MDVANYSIRGVLLIVFYLGVNSIILKEYLSFIVYFFAFYSFYEAYDWIKDSSNERSIKNVDEILKNEFLIKFNVYKKPICEKEDKIQES